MDVDRYMVVIVELKYFADDSEERLLNLLPRKIVTLAVNETSWTAGASNLCRYHQ